MNGIRNRRSLHASLAAVTLLPLFLLPGCGGAKTKSDSLATALAYFPRDAVLVVAIDTDTESPQFKAIDAVGGKFPGWDGVKREIRKDLKTDKIDFEKDLKPWLGNVAVIGVRNARALWAKKTPFLGVLVARQEQAAKRFFAKLVDNGDMEEVGSYKGAELFDDPANSADEDDQSWALSGSVVLLADTVAELKMALDVGDTDRSMKVEDFDRAVADLPEDAILRASLDVQVLIDSAKGQQTVADAQRVPWVASLSKLGMTGNVSPTEIGLKLRLGTDRRDLTDAQLPLSPDPEAPTLHVPAETFWAASLYDLEHLVRFAEEAAKAVQPVAYTAYQAAIVALSHQLGIDVNEDLLGQLKGETALFFDTDGSFGLTASLTDAQKMERVLDKLAPALRGFLEGAGLPGISSVPLKEAAGTTYALRQDGETVATYGVVGNELVVASGAEDPRAVSTSRTKQLESGKGALAIVVDLGQLVATLGSRMSLDEDIQAMKPISTVSGSASNTAQALTAEFKVSIK